MDDIPFGLSLRPAVTADGAFLERLYRSTRDDLALIDCPPELKELLIRQQREAQTRGYAMTFPDAAHLVVERQSLPIGRMVVDFGTTTLHLVDIALLPSARGKRWGTALLRWLQDRAASAGRPLTLEVLHRSDAARLYTFLGFEICEQSCVMDSMIWHPAQNPAKGEDFISANPKTC